MAGAQNTKLKLLYLIEIFKKYTDDEHVLSTGKIADILESKYGITAERKALYKDISILEEYGYDIIHTGVPSSGYFLGERDFEIAELRLLSDAVQAADFISPQKTRQLVEKIESFSSIYQARNLREQLYINAIRKTDNEMIYYVISDLDTAIKQCNMVKLVYVRRKITEQYTTQREEKEFTVNPYALIWSGDHYYVVVNNPKYDNLMHLRIDRIKSVEILARKSRCFSEITEYKNHFDCADYVGKIFNMFSGEPDKVELCCDNSIVEQMLDRFGDDVSLVRSADESKFKLRVSAAVNEGFVSWIMSFGDKIRVIYPEELKNMIRRRAFGIYNMY